MLSKSGVYQIRNTINGKRYVGSAKLFKRRWDEHRRTLRSQKHHSRYLQAAWNKYGEDSFVFEPLLVCSAENMLFYEQRGIDYLNPEYNMSPTAGSTLGVPCSEEKKKKIGTKNRGRVLTPEHREKVCAALARARTSEAFKKRSAEQACKMGKLPHVRALNAKRMRERNITPEFRAKVSAAKKGITPRRTLEQKEYQRQAVISYNQNRPITETMRENMSAAQKTKTTAETFLYEGKNQTVLAWAEEYGLCRHTLRKRINAGWGMERALTTPQRRLARG